MNPIRIFISSVQSEFAKERELLRNYLRDDTMMRRFFDVFLFEDTPALDRRPDQLYLDEVERADIYIGLFGNEYGTEDNEGVSPTEREFDYATAVGTHRMVFLKDMDEHVRQPKMQALVTRAQSGLIRKRFQSPEELIAAVYAALVEYLVGKGLIRSTPFDGAYCMKATLDDLDPDLMARFIRTARRVSQFPLAEDASPEELLEHLDLLNDGRPTNAAVLLFGKTPQKFLIASEIKCAHFHGTQVEKPIPSHQVYKGTVFDLVDQAVDFVLSKLNRSIGTRSESPRAARIYEIPKEVVTEAIVNAIAHRDYTDSSSVQVMLFSDRLEVWNSGRLPPRLTLEKLRVPHGSIPRNPLLAQSMYLVEYIERMGTGTLDMIKRCVESGLPEPKFSVEDGFIATIPRSHTRNYNLVARWGKERMADVDILVLFPDGTWKRSKTDKQGGAYVELHSVYLPMTVFAAAEGFAACAEFGWRPEERKLTLQLKSVHRGGAVIFPDGTGYIPGLNGRLNPVLDSNGRTYLHASNIAINHGQTKPVPFDYGEWLNLADDDSFEVRARVVHMIDQSALLEYRMVKSRQESIELRVLALLTNGPLSRKELSKSLGHKKISGRLNKVIPLLLNEGKVAYTLPEKPQSRLQKYRLTAKGKATISDLNTK
ncbi:MAG: DUF4062 domain-containing protein [Bacteroidota bacterium]|nr:DUF4062 domain-containing protein [Bacteroidota bacterium]